MRSILMLVTVLVVCSGYAVSADKHRSISDAELAATTARGRELADYDLASWHATDAVLALRPAAGTVGRYIARKTDSGWVVSFGRFNEAKDAFLIVYEATQGNSLSHFTVKTYEPPRRDTDFFFFAARAIEISLVSSRLEKRPYNTYVLPADSGQLYVYVLPAQMVADVYPLGGDVRYLVSADGATITETRQLHNSILEIRNSSGPKPAGGFHTTY
ncbi:MAG TPA: hypothetical protein VN780_02300 [Candidatus Eisenbacteria bacterium]|jgi:hypothetical protein|nr:hypothetical protein [Candidatus Eisenbacteria bacterium]